MTMRTSRAYAGLGIFLLHCALLAVAGPAMFWSARLGLRLAPTRVQGFVGYFMAPDGQTISHVAIPLEGGGGLYLSGAELTDSISAGMTVEKRRGELAFRFDGTAAQWPVAAAHIALMAGGLVSLAVLSVLVGRSRFRGSRLRVLGWLGAPTRVALVILPGVATLLVGVSVAFWRGELDRVTAVATIGAALVGGLGGSRGVWRRLRERAVLARARRLAGDGSGLAERVEGTVRRVERDFIELALGAQGDEGLVQADTDMSGCERLGLGVPPHPPIVVGDRLEVIGRVEHVADPTAEQLSRGVALARRLCASATRPVLVAPLPASERSLPVAATARALSGAPVRAES
jgi:hypothetical protein